MSEIKALETLAAFGKPETAIILGTGLGVMEAAIAIEHSIDYADIGFPGQLDQRCSGRLLFGRLGNAPVVVMAAASSTRLQRPRALPIRLFKRLGVKRC